MSKSVPETDLAPRRLQAMIAADVMSPNPISLGEQFTVHEVVVRLFVVGVITTLDILNRLKP